MLCPAVVEQVSLPKPGSVAIDPCLFSEMLQHYYQRCEQTMVLESPCVDRDEHAATPQFTAPGFRKPGAMLALAGRMLADGMLGTVDVCCDTISVFTVFKKLTETGIITLRAV